MRKLPIRDVWTSPAEGSEKPSTRRWIRFHDECDHNFFLLPFYTYCFHFILIHSITFLLYCRFSFYNFVFLIDWYPVSMFSMLTTSSWVCPSSWMIQPWRYCCCLFLSNAFSFHPITYTYVVHFVFFSNVVIYCAITLVFPTVFLCLAISAVIIL